VKPLCDGSYAIGFFNLEDVTTTASVQFWDMGLPASAGYGFKLRDLWAHEDAGIVTGGINEKIEAYDCKVYKATLTKL
jgi:hypothetical protein